MGENIKDLFTSYASVYSSNHLPKSSDKKSDLLQLSRFGKFIQLMADSKYKDIVSGKRTDINDDEWFNDDMDEYYTASYQDNRKKQLSDILSETGLDKYVTITSAYRTQPIGTAGTRSYHMLKNEYGNPLAYDITPASGYSFEYMSSKLTDNKEFMDWAKANGFHINDETSPAVLRRTGGTGPHFHIGPDAFNVIKKHALGGEIESEPYDIFSFARLQLSGALDQDWFKLLQEKEPEPELEPEEPVQQLNPILENTFTTNYRQYFTNYNWKNEFNSERWNRFRKHFELYATPEMKKIAGFWFALADKESSFKPNAQSKGSSRIGYFLNTGLSATNIKKQFIDADTHMKKTLLDLNSKVFEAAKTLGFGRTAVLAASWLMGAKGVKEYIFAPANRKKEFDRMDRNKVHVSDYLKWFNSTIYD